MQAPVLNMLFRDMSVSDADFQRMVRFIQDNYGIDLSKKKQLITSRLSHSLRERGYPDFSAFLDHLLKKQDPADLELVLNKLTTNYKPIETLRNTINSSVSIISFSLLFQIILRQLSDTNTSSFMY